MWYCVHAIFYFKLIESKQDSFLIHENIYLVSADDGDVASEMVEKRARIAEDTNEDGHLELNGKKAAYLFAGIRKIIEVETHPDPGNLTELSDLELSYSVYEVDTLEEVLMLAKGEMVNVLYRE